MNAAELKQKIEKLQKGLSNPNITGQVKTELGKALANAREQLRQLESAPPKAKGGTVKFRWDDYPLAKKLMPLHQQRIVQQFGEEREDIVQGVENMLKKLPSGRQGENPIVYLHYFYGKSDWFITEYDAEEDSFFGFVILNGDHQNAELGYISREELVNSSRVELDFYWEVEKLNQVKAKENPDVWGEDMPEPIEEPKPAPLREIANASPNIIIARPYMGAAKPVETPKPLEAPEPAQMAEPDIIPAPASSDCSVTRNMKQNGIEIRFQKEPTEDAKSKIKAKGFRWSKFGKLWYVKYTEALHKWTLDFCGSDTGKTSGAGVVMPEAKNERLITLASVTSGGKVPQNLLKSEIAAGKLEYAVRKEFDGMRDSWDYISEKDRVYKEARLDDDNFDIKELVKGSANRHWSDSITLDSDGTISYGSIIFRYKKSVDGHDYSPAAEREAIQAKRQQELDMAKAAAAKVVDLDATKWWVPMNRKVQTGSFKIETPIKIEDWLNKGPVEVVAEVEGYKVLGTVEAKNVVTGTRRVLFGNTPPEEIREDLFMFTPRPNESAPPYMYRFTNYRLRQPGDEPSFPGWKFPQFPTSLWESLIRNVREAVDQREKMAKATNERGKKIHAGKMADALKSIEIQKRAVLKYEEENPGLFRQVTGQNEDEYAQMLGYWRKEFGVAEPKMEMKPVVVAPAPEVVRQEVTPMPETKPEELKKPLANMLLGKKRKITLPNGEQHEGQFAIVELGKILASHNEETFADTEGYPRNAQGNNLNDRNYATDKAAQQLVEEYARNLNPDLLLVFGSTADGTPIVTPDGIVVSGNNRTMSLKLATKKYPEKYEAYRKELNANLDTFGFENLDFNMLKQPVLVRIDYDFGELTTTNMAKYNASAMKAKSPVDKAAELATTLREQIMCETNIPNILGEFDTLSDFYADRGAVRRMITAMQQCSVLNEQDMPAYVENGLFTEDGKTLLETVLGALILETDTLRIANRDGVRSLRAAVVNALPVLIANKNLPEGVSLVPHINNAVRYQGALVASGLTWENYINQGNIFNTEKADCNTVYLNRLMAKGQRVFRDAVRKYNESQSNAGANALFASEVVQPEEAFKGYIIARLDTDTVKRIEKFCGTEIAPEKQQPEAQPQQPTDAPNKSILKTRLKIVTKMLEQNPQNTVLKTRIKIIEKMLAK